MASCTVSSDTQYDIRGCKNMQVKQRIKHITKIYNIVYLSMRTEGRELYTVVFSTLYEAHQYIIF